MDGELLTRFTDYLINEVRITNNTIAKYVKTIKSFMNWSEKKGYTSNLAHKSFQLKEQEGEIYFLTLDELMKLYRMPLQIEALDRVRDVFCFGCFTGLRYSDIQNLTSANIRNGFINLTTIKTQEKNNIPLNSLALDILNKYSDGCIKSLPTISNQKMNEHLKELGKLAGFTRPVLQVRFRGAMRLEKSIPLHEVLTTHVARKTFITNSIYLGMNSEAVMEITGQKTRKAYKRYFKIVDEFKHVQMQNTWNKVSQQTPLQKQ